MYVNGVIHWVSPRRPEFGIGNLIVAFDLGLEEFRLLPQPNYGAREKDFVLDVGALEGHMCLMCNYDLVKVDVWMMKEYGLKESWSKMFSIDRCRSISSFRFLRPLICSNEDGGDKVLLEVNGEKLVWYDWKRKKLKTVKNGCDGYSCCFCCCGRRRKITIAARRIVAPNFTRRSSHKIGSGSRIFQTRMR